jgi:hypothetical protein
VSFENGGGVCETQIIDVLDELLAPLVAEGVSCPGVDASNLLQHAEVLLTQEREDLRQLPWFRWCDGRGAHQLGEGGCLEADPSAGP